MGDTRALGLRLGAEQAIIFWRTIAIALLTGILGAVGDYMIHSKDAVTRSDISLMMAPLQRQMDDSLAQGGENRRTVSDLSIKVGQLEEDFKLSQKTRGK